MQAAAGAAALLILAGTLFGCSLFGSEEESSAPPAESSVSTAPPESEASSGSDVVNSIATGDEAFDEAFAENPIDASYRLAQEDAYSTTDMLQLANDYAAIWENEVDSAYKRLLDEAGAEEREQVRAEQEQWVAETPAALQAIAEQAEAEGGSLSRVTAASAVMEYYRTRASELYRRLYELDGSLNLAYSAQG